MALEDTASSTNCRTTSNHLITPTNCTGAFHNDTGTCSATFNQNITFPSAYATVPHVLVSPEYTSYQDGCV